MKKVVKSMALCLLSAMLIFNASVSSLAYSEEYVNEVSDEASVLLSEEDISSEESSEEISEETTEEILEDSEEEISEEIIIESAEESSIEDTDEEIEDSSIVAEDEEEFTAATGGNCGENATWSFNGSTLTISGSGAMTDYTLSTGRYTIYPEYDAPWFEYRDKVKKIVISDKITHIGAASFCGMTLTSEVQLPSKLESLGEYAFFRVYLKCSKANLVIPGTVKFIEANAFCRMSLPRSSGSTLKLSEGITEIGEYAFEGFSCDKITWPSTLERIDDHAFDFSSYIHDFTIPAVKYIGKCAFYHLQGTKTITFLGELPEIDDDAFIKTRVIAYYDPKYKSFTKEAMDKVSEEFTAVKWLPVGTKPSNKAGDNISWSFNSSNRTLTFKGSGDMYDYDRTNLPDWYIHAGNITYVKMDSKITSIGDYAFYNMGTLQSLNPDTNPLVLPTNVKKIGAHAFEETFVCNITMPKTCERVEEYAFYRSDIQGKNNQMPSGVKYIGDYAYASLAYTKDMKVNLSEVEEIGDYAFYSSSIAWDNAFSFPGTIKRIGENAFYYCSKLTGELSVPEGCKIGNKAFYYCKGLSGTFKFTAKNADLYDTIYATSISKIIYDKSVTKLNGNTYRSLNSITDVVFEGDCPEIKNDFFYFGSEHVTISYPYDTESWHSRIPNFSYNKDKVTFKPVGESATVTFYDPYGNKITSTKVKMGEKAVAPEVTLKNGDKLGFWYTEKDPDRQFDKNVWDFSNEVPGRMNLYAGLKYDGCKIIFNTNGGEPVKSLVLEKGSKIGEHLPTDVKKTGYILYDWYYDSKCTNKVYYNDTIEADTELFAKWYEAYLTYVFNDHYNRHDDLPYTYYRVGQYKKVFTPDYKEITERIAEYEATGHYKFLGWYLDEECTKKVPDNYTIIDQTYIYAKWNRLTKCTISIDYDGGKYNGKSKRTITVDYDTYVPEITEKPTRDGYCFKTWQVNYDGMEYQDYFPGQRYIYGDANMKALWTETKPAPTPTPEPEPEPTPTPDPEPTPEPSDDPQTDGPVITVDGKNISNSEIKRTYTGKAIKLDSLKIVYDGTELVLGKDYKVTYSNNKNASTDKKKAKAKIKFKGSYKGTTTISYTILPLDLNCDQDCFDTTGTAWTIKVNGKVQKPKAVFSHIIDGKKKKLKKNKDYKLLYNDATPGAYKEAGVYRYEMCGMGNYTGSIYFNVMYTEAKLIKKLKVSGLKKSYVFNDQPVCPSFKLMDGKKTVAEFDGSKAKLENDYYTVNDSTGKYECYYLDCDKTGQATIYIIADSIEGYKGKEDTGKLYSGEKVVHFKIKMR